jgi:hypothetical protein
MPTVFCKFENGRESGIDAGDESEAIGFVQGLAAAARCLNVRVWVTTTLPDEGGQDDDCWMSPDTWLELHH